VPGAASVICIKDSVQRLSIAAAIAVSLITATAAFAASTNFVPLATETAGDTAFRLAAADLDGDLDQDLAVVNNVSDDVTILRNTGGGDFVEPASSPEAVGPNPHGIAAADLDGDGDQDLAVPSPDDDDVTILRNNGVANFTEPASSPEPAGEFAIAVAAADLDGDGDRDLAVANRFASQVTILRNNGLGNFVERQTSPEPAGTGPYAILAADLDGDADADLAVTNADSHDVSVLRNNGSGNFSEPPSSPEPVDLDPVAIVAPDLDGDDDLDLAVTSQTTAVVTVLRNVGAGEFVEPVTSPEAVGMSPSGIAAADFDLDGDRDLAVANVSSDNVTILRNTGTANFIEPPSSPEATDLGPWSIVAADFDGDLDADLATTNSASVAKDVSVLRNR
jgi:hypothetical protein